MRDAPQVTVVGGANVDIHGRPAGPLCGRDSNPGTVLVSAGGVARNVAENLTRLGVGCRLISVVGDDHHGAMLLRRMREAGIDTQDVHTIADATTSTYLAVLDDSGDLYVAIADMGIMAELDADRLREHAADVDASALIVIDANLTVGALEALAGMVTATPVFADTVSAGKAPVLRGCLASIHTLKTSALEVEALTGAQARTPGELRQVAAQLHAAGVERVFVTLGSQGLFYSTTDAEGVMEYPGGPAVVANAGGAGDAFLAGLAYAWLQNWPLGQSLEFALAVAEITLSHPATSSPALSPGAVERLLEARRGG